MLRPLMCLFITAEREREREGGEREGERERLLQVISREGSWPLLKKQAFTISRSAARGSATPSEEESLRTGVRFPNVIRYLARRYGLKSF